MFNILKFFGIFTILMAFVIVNAWAAEIKSSNHDSFGIKCVDCHNVEIPNKTADVSACINCHGTFDDMIPVTEKKFEANPHSPHNPDVTCLNCHKQHSKGVNYCNERCHDFDFEVK